MEIIYRELVPGRRHFDCPALKAELSTAACAARHELARQHTREGHASACLRCLIGVRHAASAGAAPSASTIVPDSGATCCRCGRHGLRILPSKGLCVSCSNRAAEYAKGRNAKGEMPIEYVPPVLRRAGVVVDSRPVWRLFESQNATEPLARARRAGLVMHTDQPGAVCWCPKRQAFEYRDKGGQTLTARQIDTRLEYVPATKHDQLAPVVDAGISMHPEALKAWLAIAGDGLSGEWQPQAVICGRCHHAPLQARKRAGRVGCRCSACGAENGGSG